MSSNSHCRFCGEIKNTEHLIDIYEDQNTLKDCNKIIDLLQIDFIDLKSTSLPKSSCITCIKLLKDFNDFLIKMKEAQNYLNKLYMESSEDAIIKEESFDEKSSYGNEDISLDLSLNDTEVKEDLHDSDKADIQTEIINLLENSIKTTKIEGSIINTTKLEDADFIKSKKRKTSYTASSKKLLKVKNTELRKEISWTDYGWTCQHCDAKFDSMSEVRDHSKVVHAICYGFKCTDCTELFNYFNPFVEHVRLHRESLQFYCHYCNLKCATPELTAEHSVTHWQSAQICEWCGELLLSPAALQRHKKVYKKAVLPQKFYKKKPKKIKCDVSWDEYEWTCQDCLLKLPDAKTLRKHTRDFHRKCFAIKCVDCLVIMTNYKHFIEHVTAHRACLKNYCYYCNAYYPKPMELDQHIVVHLSEQKPCEGCGEMFPDSTTLAQHMTLFDAPKVRGASSTEALTCGVCNKQFPNAFQLRNHKVIHSEERERDQICHTCGKAFYDIKTLTNHIKTHFNKTEMCEICKKTFLTKQRLKVHLTTHLETKKFVCNECNKKFRRKSQLRLHLVSHSNVLPFQCAACNKSFRLQSYLKIHERQHTGIRPFACEICNETFNHWGNCNRHMIRKHGVTFAKTKITAHGKLDINRQTGETNTIDIGSNTREWCDEMLKPKKRGRKKKEG